MNQKNSTVVSKAWALLIVLMAAHAGAQEDLAAKVTDPDQPIEHVWPDFNAKPSKAARSCRSDLFRYTKVKPEAEFLYESQFLSFCRFNEYRMSMYLECAKTLASEIHTTAQNTIPSFCNHAQGFSKNEYRSYTSCLSTLYSSTDLYGGFISSVCEQSRGKKDTVDCIVAAIGRGKRVSGSQEELQLLDSCLKM